jgi:hypothetical protein
MPKFTALERNLIKSIVATLSIKRIPDSEIIKEVFNQTKKLISPKSLYNIKQRIKKESAKWYCQLRQGEYEYIHEFKERINEIVDLQKRHYKIIEDNANNPSIQEVSLAALHKLNVTLSNYFDVAPVIDTHQKRQLQVTDNSIQDQDRTMFKIEGCTCPHDGRDIISHYKCRYCLCIWCPTALSRIGVLTLNVVIA